MKTIISTFDESSECVIEGLTQFGCKNLILIIPTELKTKKSKDGLEKIQNFVKEGNIKIEIVRVSPYSLMENIQKLKEIIENIEDEFIINITGGKKTLSLAAAMAGFVSNPNKIVYIKKENNQVIEIPRFTMYERLLSFEKRIILKSIKANTTLEEIKKSLKTNGIHKNYPVLMKHLRELEKKGLIKISNSRPHKYSILPSGELLI